jgi:hypothetical protein
VVGTLGLGDRLDHKPAQLSGGLRLAEGAVAQRLADLASVLPLGGGPGRVLLDVRRVGDVELPARKSTTSVGTSSGSARKVPT